MNNVGEFIFAIAVLIILVAAAAVATYWVYRTFGLMAVIALILFTVVLGLALIIYKIASKNP